MGNLPSYRIRRDIGDQFADIRQSPELRIDVIGRQPVLFRVKSALRIKYCIDYGGIHALVGLLSMD